MSNETLQGPRTLIVLDEDGGELLAEATAPTIRWCNHLNGQHTIAGITRERIADLAATAEPGTIIVVVSEDTKARATAAEVLVEANRIGFRVASFDQYMGAIHIDLANRGD